MRIAESPAGRIRDESGQADFRESIINRSAEIIREWMINGSAPGEYALSELYETARSAARDGLAAEDAVRACGRAARAVWNTLLEFSLAEHRARAHVSGRADQARIRLAAFPG